MTLEETVTNRMEIEDTPTGPSRQLPPQPSAAPAPLFSIPPDPGTEEESQQSSAALAPLFPISPDQWTLEELQPPADNMARAPFPGWGHIDSGYVYLGQFLAHEIANPQDRSTDGTKRTPALDLDAIYGRVGQPLPDTICDSRGRMRLSPGGWDLPRNPDGSAIVVDERSDKNLLASQLHLQFLKLHNYFLDHISSSRGGTTEAVFNATREQLILHYQEVVLYDLLRTWIDERVWEQVIERGRATLPVDQWRAMPPEFEKAAFRFGHSMVRGSYTINEALSLRVDELFDLPGGELRVAGEPVAVLPEDRVVDWRYFFRDMDDTPRVVNRAEPISPFMPLRPKTIVPLRPKTIGGDAIAPRDMKASNHLPSGQRCVQYLQEKFTDLANDIGLKLLTPEELNPQLLTPKERGKETQQSSESAGTTPARLLPDSSSFGQKTPLGYYILAEAYHTHQGRKLGPLGSLIVAESLRAAISMSSPSIFSGPYQRLIAPTNLHLARPYLRMCDLLRAVNQEKPAQDVASALPMLFVRAAAHRASVAGKLPSTPPLLTATRVWAFSDEKVVDRFIGKFISIGEWTRDADPSKDAYYPRAGVALEFYKVKLRGREGEAYAKLKMPDAAARLVLESAIYRAVGNDLVAEDIEIEPGLLLQERLTIIEGRMEHHLTFSDETSGIWICWDSKLGGATN